MKVQAGLELADHEVIVGISLDALDGETANPRVDLAGQHVGFGIAGLKIEGLLAVEGEDLGRRHHVATAEDSKAGVFIGDFGRLFPGEVDGVVDNVVDGKVTHAEGRGEGSAAESAATSNSLILVKGEGKALAEELGDSLLDRWHTRAATNHLDVVNILDLELGLSERLLQRHGNPVQERLDHLLELLTLNHSADISILHQRLDAQGGLRVGRQDLLELLSGSEGTRPGFGVSADVNLELLLELVGETLRESIVEVTATEVTVISGSLHIKLTLAELYNGGSVVTVTDIDEQHAARLLLRSGQIQLGDPVTESSSGSVVNETEHVEASDFTGINHGPALDIGEPSRNTNGDVGDGLAEFLGSNIFDLGQVHGNQLSRREFLLLAHVADLNTGLSIDVTEGSRSIFLLNLDIRVVERTADEALERAHGILQVRGLLCLGGLANLSAAGTESDEGPVGHKFSSQLLQLQKKKFWP